MTVEQIEFQWGKVSNTIVERGFHSIRISSECIPELFLGKNSEGLRNLILSIPKNHEFQFRGIDKQNLSIEFYKESNHIVLKLVNLSFTDLFNDLILSLYNKICSISDVDTYCKEFIRAFYRWNGFFTDISGDGLSEDAIKGLLGELFVLKDLVEASNTLTVNDTLYSWKGPYDAVNDFESEKSLIEVKTKDDSKIYVRISSEFQLSGKPDKQLSLCIVSVVVDTANGFSVGEVITSIKDLVWEKLGDVSIFIDALAQKGLFNQTLPKYNHFRFRPLTMAFYDCDHDFFPSIKTNQLAEAISDVSYNLRISMLEEFKISEKLL